MKSGVGINWVCFTLPIKNLNFINIFIKENILDILKVFKVNKKGASNVNANIDKLLSGVLLILFTVVLAPVIFGTDGLANAGFVADAPAWVVTLLTVIIGIGLVVFVYRSFTK